MAMPLPKIYTVDQIEQVINRPSFQKDLIDGISDGFVALENGQFNAAPIQTLGAPPLDPFVQIENYAAQTCVKSGYFTNNPYYVIKVASGGYPLQNSGLMQVYSQQTGALEALLLDHGVLTEWRTAAVGALAAQLLAPKTIREIGILGTGVQARYQLDMLKIVTQCRNVRVWGRSPERMMTYQRDMEWKGWEIALAKEPDDLLESCDLIVATTCARDAVIGKTGKVPKDGALITCIGADAVGKMEIDIQLVDIADLLVADMEQQSRERGEFQHWSRLMNGNGEICSLGQLIQTPYLHRKQENDNRFIIFDSSGVALQDCVVAQMVYEALK